MATYGGRNDENLFTIPQLKGDSSGFYTITDAKTGESTLYRKQIGGAIFGDAIVGTYEPDGNFTPGKDFEDVFDKNGQKKFLSDETQKGVKNQTLETVVRAQKETGVDEIVARKRANELLETGSQTTPTDADSETIVNEKLNDLSNLKIDQRSGTRSGTGSFGELRYPKAFNNSQDFVQFTMLEYKTKKVNQGSFGFGDRTRVGPNGQAEGRTRLGSVGLPIPGGIRDENGANWGGKSMNEMQIQASNLARSLTGASGDNSSAVVDNIMNTVGSNSPEVRKAIQEGFASNAVGQGFGGLLSRTRGAVFNPNLELLFEGPTLRPFTFSFDLAARNKEEANEIIKIIRFFKQGSSPIRSKSNLFLLAPHTFQVHYILAGDNGSEHPYIGRMKECAVTKVGVDYTPQQNYSTLKDGYMTNYKLTLQMQELEPIFNDDYNDIDTKASGAFSTAGPLALSQIDDAAGIGF